MKRAMSRKEESAPSSLIGTDTVSGQSKQAAPESSRRARTSAAVIGLALSVGAHGLVLTRPGEAATTDPVPAESAPSVSEGVNPEADEESSAVILPSPELQAITPGTEPVLVNRAPQTVVPAQSVVGNEASEVPTQGVLSNASRSDSRGTNDVVLHAVREGQTLWKIAQIYGIQTKEIAALNGISPTATLTVGQTLKVPVSETVPTVVQTLPEEASVPAYYGQVALQPEVTPAPSAPVAVSEAVSPSENIASATNLEKQQTKTTTNSQAKAVEKVSEPSLEKQKSISATRPVESAQPENRSAEVAVAVRSYRVTAGDTISAIARTHGVSKQELIRANGITNPNLIRVNQTLIIPSKVAAVRTLPVLPTELTETASAEEATESQVKSNDETIQAYRIQPLQTQQTSEQTFTPGVLPEKVQAESTTAPDYVANLRQEISKLREKYNQPSVKATVDVSESVRVAVVSTPAAAPAVVTQNARVNPELPTQPARQQAVESAPIKSVATVKRPQQVAVAPVGSESYDPILESAIGKVVSPELPAIGAPDSYLPNSQTASKGFIWPTRGVLTSGYGWRWGRMHKGIDIAAPVGTPILAAADGKVTYSRWNSGGYGNLVEITHPDGTVTLYAHNNRLLVKEGQQVTQGQQIAEMGSTGYSTGPHCHFEIHLPGKGAINPMTRLARR